MQLDCTFVGGKSAHPAAVCISWSHKGAMFNRTSWIVRHMLKQRGVRQRERKKISDHKTFRGKCQKPYIIIYLYIYVCWYKPFVLGVRRFIHESWSHHHFVVAPWYIAHLHYYFCPLLFHRPPFVCHRKFHQQHTDYFLPYFTINLQVFICSNAYRPFIAILYFQAVVYFFYSSFLLFITAARCCIGFKRIFFF